MSVGDMLDEGTLAQLQADAESLMTDTCRITATGKPTFDQGTKKLVTPPPTTVYEGKCRLRPTGTDRTVEVGDARIMLPHAVLSVPAAASGIGIGQQVEILTSVNPALPGQKFMLRNPQPGSQVTAQRWDCEVAS